MRINHLTRAAGMALASLALVAPVTLAQDATPMASPAGTGMTL